MKYDRAMSAIENIKNDIQNKINNDPACYIVNNEIDVRLIINEFGKQLKKETKLIWIDLEDLQKHVSDDNIKLSRIKHNLVLEDEENEFIIKPSINYCDYFVDNSNCTFNIKIHTSIKGDISYWKHYINGIKFGSVVVIDITPLSVMIALTKK